MAKTLKVGIIGVGGISRTHIPGWDAAPHAELVAGCDIQGDVLKDWGKQHNIKKLVTQPRELFEDEDIDIIDVCTPNMYHAPLAIASLEAGKHVICEKPLAPTPKEIRKMIAARDKSGKLLMTAQHMRFEPSSKAMKAEIGLGALGDVYHSRSWILRRGGSPSTSGFIHKKNSGGGCGIDIGVHILDLTLWFMGNPRPATVTGVARAALAHQRGAFSTWDGPIPESFDVEDFAAAFVRFDNGATLVLEVSWLLHHNSQGEDMQMWLYGTHAGAHWPKCEFVETNYETRQHYKRTLELFPTMLEAHAQECVEFSQAVVDGAPSPVPAEESLQVISILDAIYRSQAKGGEVSVHAV